MNLQPKKYLPQQENFVIRNAHLLSMDEKIGNKEDIDILVDKGLIRKIGVELDAPKVSEIDGNGMIVMPGFVDAHWHLWSTIFRNLLRVDRGYFDLLRGLASHFNPEDFYHSCLLALSEATNAGITTVLNFSHNTRSPTHADAEIIAHIDSGLRGRYSYGHISGMPSTQRMPIDDISRVQQEWFGNTPVAGERLKLGYSWRGPLLTAPPVYRWEFDAAKNLGLPITTHGGQGPPYRIDAVQMKEEGFLGPDTLLVHFLEATSNDRKTLVETKTPLTISMQSELRFGVGCDLRSHLLHCLNDGINLCLSVDATSAASVNPFENMSTAWYVGASTPDTPPALIPSVNFKQCLEMATINGARAMGLENQIGSLTPGKCADLIMIRMTDINMAPFGELEAAVVRSATPANVDTVIVDGRILKRNGKLTSINVDKVVASASNTLHSVLSRAGENFAPSTTIPRPY